MPAKLGRSFGTLAAVIQPLAIFVAITSCLFMALAMLPTDAATVIAGADAQRAQQLRAELQLDQPAWLRLLRWWQHVASGDFGTSWQSGRPCSKTVVTALQRTVALALPVWTLALVLGTGLSAVIAWNKNHPVGRFLAAAVGMAIGLPEVVWVVVVMASVVVVSPQVPRVAILPPGVEPWQQPSVMVVPALALLVPSAAWTARMTQGLAENIVADPVVRSARTRGVPPFTTVLRFLLPQLMTVSLSVYAMIGLGVFGGSVVVEAVTAYPGLGTVVVTASTARDIPVLMTVLCALTALSLTMLTLSVKLQNRFESRRSVAHVDHG